MKAQGVARQSPGRQNGLMTHFRQIALTVDEQDSGHYYWVLIESSEDARLYDGLKACQEPFGTYMEALEAGFPSCVEWSIGGTA